MSTLGGVSTNRVELTIPPAGDWRADVVLESGTLPTVGAPTTLVIGDLTMLGVVEAAAFDAPDRPHVVVTGAPGWDALVVAPISFQSDAGVRLSTVLAALSAAAGQPYSPPPVDVVVGNYFELIASRPSEPVRYRDALSSLARAGVLAAWRVDPDGVTRFGARPGLDATVRATVLRQSASAALTVVGVDAPAAFLPGNTFGGVPISKLVLTDEGGGKLEAQIWAGPSKGAPSIRELNQRMVASLLSELVRTYVVAAVAGDGRLDLVPPPDSPHLPEMRNVEQWTMGGAIVKPTLGALVLVVFRDAYHTRPIVVAFGPGTPMQIAVDASGVVAVGAGASGVELAGAGSDIITVPGAEAGRYVRYGESIMFPVGPTAIPTALPILGSAPGATPAPLPPFPASKVT